MSIRRLTRLRQDGKIAGVCAGLADYFEVDPVLIRAVWVILSIVPGAIIGGVIAYLAAWMVMPEATGPASAPLGRRITRSVTDKKIAGVCGGLADTSASTPLPCGCSGASCRFSAARSLAA